MFPSICLSLVFVLSPIIASFALLKLTPLFIDSVDKYCEKREKDYQDYLRRLNDPGCTITVKNADNYIAQN